MRKHESSTGRRQEDAALSSYLGGNGVVLDGGRSYAQNQETGQKTRIDREEGQRVVHLWLPSKEGEAQEETERGLKGNRLAILATGSGSGFRQAGVSAESPQEQHEQNQIGS